MLNEFTDNKYKNNQNKIYDVAEALIISFLNDKIDDVEVISSSLHLFSVYDEYGCERFKRILYQILSSDNYSKLYHEIRLMQEEKESDKTSRIE